MGNLMEELDKERNNIKTDSYDMSIGELISLYQDGDVKLNPAYQRLYRWDKDHKVRFIESILIGIPIPEIFVAQKKDGKWDIVDGVQRISTLLQLVGELPDHDPLVLEATKYLPSLEGMTWETMPADAKRLLKRARIGVNIILTENSIESQYELFQRLNTGGVSLESQEIRNCLIIMLNENYYNKINELKNYEYYNDVFRKYHIDKAEFDSCLYYYSAQTVLFSKMYDVVIDSIHRQLTAIEKVLNELKSKDSVNYFPLVDTLKLDSVFTITVDSIVPGLYKFGTTIHFDSLQNTQNRRIRSYFLSADGNDTLRVRDLVVDFDTLKRSYNWSQYADSVYNRLVITFLDTMPPAKYIKPVKGKKTPPAKKEKLVKLDEMGGEAWGTYLYRPYVSRDTEKRLKQSLRRRYTQFDEKECC